MTALELLYQIETEMLANMLRLLNRGAIGSAVWQAEKLSQIGTLQAMNREAIEQNLRKAIEAAMQEIEARTREGAQVVDTEVNTRNLAEVLPIESSAKLKAVTSAWARISADSMNRMSATMLKSAADVYTKTVETVTAEVLTGNLTGRQAIAQTSAKWAQNGINAFVDSAGRNWTTEAYAQTIIRTTTRNARREAQFERMDEYGFDLILVSSHIGARPGCAPYQGKVYSRTGKTPGYPTLATTSYGEPAGLFGINCGHTSSIYVPGTEKAYKPYPAKENAEAYKESQVQRGLERAIRRDKRALYFASIDGGDDQIAHYKKQVADRQAVMREFIDESGRTRRRDREQIYQ